ncbi:MAG: N-acetyltransferase [Candidatus Cloacimonetes bacterium]|nr:N-acetyltransferase [Candidatus Cloacimonadota bacterium]
MKVNIRQENPSDYAEVYDLVKMSFTTDGKVADYLNEVRTKDIFMPELSLVAEDSSGKIVGQVVLYETDILTPMGKRTELLLSPICVHPDYFRQGIARALANKALGLAKAEGYKAVFLCGELEFYRKLGFVPTFEYGIYHHTDEGKMQSGVWCMNLSKVS